MTVRRNEQALLHRSQPRGSFTPASDHHDKVCNRDNGLSHTCPCDQGVVLAYSVEAVEDRRGDE